MSSLNKLNFLKQKAHIKDIPYNWNLDTVGNSCAIRNNLRKPISVDERNKIKGIYPYYGPTGILSYINEYLAEGKFALIGEDGDHFLKYNEKIQTQLVNGKFNVNNHAHIIESTKKCLAEWFFIFFKHRNITEFLTRQGAGRYKLNKDTLKRLPILLPPLPEQKAIADILSTWDSAIEKTENLIVEKENRFKWLLNELINKKAEKEDWKEVKLGNVCNIKKGTQLSKIDMKPEGKYYVLNGGIGLSGYTDKWNIEKNTITISEGGNSCGYVNLNVEKFWSGGHCYSLSDLKSQVNIMYLFNFLKLHEKKIMKLRVGSGLPNIQKKDLLKFIVLLPSIPVQKDIASSLNLAKNETDCLKDILENYKIQKHGLMQKLLTGKWRVKVK